MRYGQWRKEVCWCPGRLLDCMPPLLILALSGGVSAVSAQLCPLPNAYRGPRKCDLWKKFCYISGPNGLKQNILIADTILQSQASNRVLRFGEEKYIFRGKVFIFIICLKQIFLSTTKLGGHKKDLGTISAEFPPGQNRRQKVFSWGPSYLCWGLDVLKIYFWFTSRRSVMTTLSPNPSFSNDNIITEGANMKPVKACAPRWTFSSIRANW